MTGSSRISLSKRWLNLWMMKGSGTVLKKTLIQKECGCINLEADIFHAKIKDICNKLGYRMREIEDNIAYLGELVDIRKEYGD